MSLQEMLKEERKNIETEKMENWQSKQTIKVRWRCSVCEGSFSSDARDYAYESETHLLNHKDRFITKIVDVECSQQN